METSEVITLCDLCSQGIELRRRRLWCVLRGKHLSLANRMHDFYAGNRTPRRPERLEAEHGTRQPFHGAMVLLYEVIKILNPRVRNE